ncbi:MAG: hypothetical protein M1836_002684 [Candelina mexicana]|nr:MAG: hypothetical protein M1836_002684 [Candelina mexicana]
MAAGLGEAASVLSIVSLTVQLFDGCIKGFVLLTAAQELGSRAELLMCKLEWEHYCLNSWATTVGLFENPPELKVPAFQVPVVQNTLSALGKLLNDASRMKEDYGLHVSISDEELLAMNTSKRRFGGMLRKSKPQFESDTAKVWSRRNGAWKKLKWSSIDAEKLELLIRDIGYFNRQLQRNLFSFDQEELRKDENAIMRSMIAQTSDRVLLDVMDEPLIALDKTLAAAARLKHHGLLLNLVEPTNRSLPSLSTTTTLAIPAKSSLRRMVTPVGSARELRREWNLMSDCQGHVDFSVNREVAQYGQQVVIVEWKDVDSNLESKLKYRVANVASLLSKMNDPAFHALSCIGFLKSAKSARYAYIFKPPISTIPRLVIKSLRDLLTASSLQPSINDRLKVAVAMTETLLQLHTAGWLHKAIRPDNIVFFTNSVDNWTKSDGMAASFLGGYEYARADNPLESTEDPSSQKYPNLYRHPLSLGQKRSAFTKDFDRYSLGCVLLELGLWSPLQTILLRRVRRSAKNNADLPVQQLANSALSLEDDTEYYEMMGAKQSLLQSQECGSIRAELEHRMGRRYAEVAMDCINAATNANAEATEDDGDSLETEEMSLIALKELAAVM